MISTIPIILTSKQKTYLGKQILLEHPSRFTCTFFRSTIHFQF